MKFSNKFTKYTIEKIGLVFFIYFMVCLGFVNILKAQSPSINDSNVVEDNKLIADSQKKNISDSDRKEDAIIVIGASFVEAWPIQEIGGVRTINKGVAGEQSFEMLQRFEKDVLSLNPRAVIIWGFMNDIHRTLRKNIDAAMLKARESIEEMVLLAKRNGIEPILVTEVTIRGKDDLRNVLAGWIGRIRGKASYQDYVNGHVLDMNQWIRKYAEENDIVLFDFQPLIADEKGFRKKEFANEDGIHISPAAYEQLTAYAKAKFNASRTNNRVVVE